MTLVLGVALSLTAGFLLLRAKHSRLHVLACVSNSRLDDPSGWEHEARAALGSTDSRRCPSVKTGRTWWLPPQAGLPEGGVLTLAEFDGQATCEADRMDPRVLVVGDRARAHGAIRLPDNTVQTDLEVFDGGARRLALLVRTEVWRSNPCVIVATWDPLGGAVESELDTSSLSWEYDYTCSVQSPLGARYSSGPTPPGKRCEVAGAVFDVMAMKR